MAPLSGEDVHHAIALACVLTVVGTLSLCISGGAPLAQGQAPVAAAAAAGRLPTHAQADSNATSILLRGTHLLLFTSLRALLMLGMLLLWRFRTILRPHESAIRLPPRRKSRRQPASQTAWPRDWPVLLQNSTRREPLNSDFTSVAGRPHRGVLCNSRTGGQHATDSCDHSL
jgi:hypothetical protein